VFFVDPPGRWAPRNLRATSLGLERVQPGLDVLRYVNMLPSGYLGSPLVRLNDWLNGRRLARGCKVVGDVLFWQFDPSRFVSIHAFPGARRILHVVDPYRWRTDLEIAASADLVVGTNPSNLERYSGLATRTLLVPHGISEEDRESDRDRVHELARTYGSYVLFVGTLNHHVDFELLARISVEFPRNRLVLVGPEQGRLTSRQKRVLESLARAPNVCRVGVVHAKRLRDYIRAAAVCIIPYREEGALRTPLKALHYIAQCRPVVSRPFPELEPLVGDLVFFATEHAAFLEQLRNALQRPQKGCPAPVLDYLARVTYPRLISRILGALES
jgi:glycosyltransferase involved in cell wall biosynthesis